MAAKPKAVTPDPELEQIAAIARAGAGRSVLYRWLRQRHDDFAALLEETRPNWAKLAEGFASLGMKTTDGKALTGETVRHTWWRVRRDVAAGRAKRAARTRPAPHAPAPVAAAPPE